MKHKNGELLDPSVALRHLADAVGHIELLRVALMRSIATEDINIAELKKQEKEQKQQKGEQT